MCKTRLVQTSFKDYTEWLNLLQSVISVAKKWCALWAHKIFFLEGFELKVENSESSSIRKNN
jgi:hypothetical protein